MTAIDSAFLQTIKWHQLTKNIFDSSDNPPAQLDSVQYTYQLPAGVLKKIMWQRDIT